MPRRVTYKRRGRKTGGGWLDWLPNPFSKPNTSPGTTQGQQPNPVSGPPPASPTAGGKRKTIKNKTKKSKK